MIGQNDSKNVLMKFTNINGLMLPKFNGLADLAQGHLPVNGKFSIENNVKAIAYYHFLSLLRNRCYIFLKK